MKMKIALSRCLILAAVSLVTAGDEAGGKFTAKADFSKPFSTYSLSKKDSVWIDTLTNRLDYTGRVDVFAKTSIKMLLDSLPIEDQIYQHIKTKDVFYIATGDLMVEIDSQAIYSPGVGGFSMHFNRKRNFLVALNFHRGGVPVRKHSPIKLGLIEWKSDSYSRLK